MEGAVAARVNFNASTTAGSHISSCAGPRIGANIFPRVNAKIGASLFFSVSDKIFADISLRADDEIFFRPHAQERQTSRSDYSGRRRASERFA